MSIGRVYFSLYSIIIKPIKMHFLEILKMSCPLCIIAIPFWHLVISGVAKGKPRPYQWSSRPYMHLAINAPCHTENWINLWLLLSLINSYMFVYYFDPTPSLLSLAGLGSIWYCLNCFDCMHGKWTREEKGVITKLSHCMQVVTVIMVSSWVICSFGYNGSCMYWIFGIFYAWRAANLY